MVVADRGEGDRGRSLSWPIGRLMGRSVVTVVTAPTALLVTIREVLARIMYEPPAATADLAILPGVLGSRTLRRTDQVRLRSEPLWLPGATTISTISLRCLVHNAG